MKNEQRPFVSLRKSFDDWVRAIPKSECAKLKEEVRKWDVAFKLAKQLLFWWKLAPQVEKGPPFYAKWASQDLKDSKGAILGAVKRNDKRFFIDLGKCLSGEMNSGMHDKMDECVALILAYNPSIRARNAVHVLEKFGCPRITEDNFRVRKQRLKRAVGEYGFYMTARKQRSQRKRRPRQ